MQWQPPLYKPIQALREAPGSLHLPSHHIVMNLFSVAPFPKLSHLKEPVEGATPSLVQNGTGWGHRWKDLRNSSHTPRSHVLCLTKNKHH